MNNPLPPLDNPNEILDLVDSDNTVIGTISRGEVHKNPQRIHRHVAVLLVDDQKRILLQKRSLTRVSSPGKWTISVAGHIPAGMDSLDAAHKEMLEEVGFDTSLTFLKKTFHCLKKESFFTFYYLGQYEGEAIVFDPEESTEVKFFSKQEYIDLIKKEGVVVSAHQQTYEEYWSITSHLSS